MIAIKKGKIVGVQICGEDFAFHVKKIRASKYFKLWLDSGAEFLLMGYRKGPEKRGSKKMVYKLRAVWLTEDEETP